MGYGGETAQFHVETGPAALFDRIRMKMKGKKHLGVGHHVEQRAKERNCPLSQIRDFDCREWNLKAAEVGTKNRKFVNSAWHRVIDGRDWLVVIGLGDVLMTVIDSDRLSVNTDTVQEGALYDRVRSVNMRLLKEDGSLPLEGADRI